MYQLNGNELMSIRGVFGIWGVFSIIGGLVFLIGLIDGYIRPLRCNR